MRRRITSLRQKTGLGLLAVLVFAASSTSCVSLLGGGPTAPSGLSAIDQELRRTLAAGKAERAVAMVSDDETANWVGDELLRLQYEGLAAHYAGRWEESSRALERAFELNEDRYTKNVTRGLLSLVSSDRILAYNPPHPEQLFFHYYGALNYLRRGKRDEAAVEARRLGHLLRQALVEDDSSVPPPMGQALSVFAGAVFEIAGQSNDAAVSYRRARAFRERAGDGESTQFGHSLLDSNVSTGQGATDVESGPWPNVIRTADDAAAGTSASTRQTGRILVVLERGFVAHKVERDLTLFLQPREVRRLHSYRRAAVTDTVSPDSSEIMKLAEQVAERSLGGASRRDRDRQTVRGGDSDLTLLRVAWPELRETFAPSGPATLRVRSVNSSEPSRSYGVGPGYRADLSQAVREAYRRSRPQKVAKALMRAIAKQSIAEGVEDAISEEDETVGKVLGAALQVGGALLERADTRSWHLLPAQLEYYLLRLPPGTHWLEARVGGGNAEDRRIPIGTVELEGGSLTIVTAREWH